VVDRAPNLVRALDAVSARLDTATLRTLNAQVRGRGQGDGRGSFRAIAQRWLDAEQLP
jgi:glycine betaine/choline ABC-type transport system substrate-binding protein